MKIKLKKIKEYFFKLNLKLKSQFKTINSFYKFQDFESSQLFISIKSWINNLQDLIEKKFKKFSVDESLLEQDNFWIKSVTWALIGTSSFSIIWLVFAETEEIVVATGKLEPMGEVKDVQIPLGGVIKKILVESGERVSEDQTLVELDNEVSLEKLKSLRTALAEKEYQLQNNTSIFSLKQSQYIQELEIFDKKIKNLKNQLDTNSIFLRNMKILLAEGAVSKFEYLDQKLKVDELNNELSQLEVQKNRLLTISSQELQVIESDQAANRSEIASIKSKLAEAKLILKYQSLKAPVDGIVFDLKPNSEGYVAQTSEPIMKIVPFNELQAYVEIPSRKIGFVEVNMPAEISIDSFPSTDFGPVIGKVGKIGSDALPPSQIDLRTEYSYPVIVNLDNQELTLSNGSNLPLQVGMSLTANIKLRKVSYLKLLFSKFDKKTQSLREY